MKNNAQYEKPVETFCVLGISYKNSDIALREKYSLSVNDQEEQLSKAKHLGLSSLIILSTCNRTEVYGWNTTPNYLKDYLLPGKETNKKELLSICYRKKGLEAIEHFFRVSCGLDSQILGDFEIAGQIKTAFLRSQKHGLINTQMERLTNLALKTGKKIKNETEISSGITSVSYAAVQYILSNIHFYQEQKILLVGAGKIGRNTIANLVKHGVRKITIINRTNERAQYIAKNYYNVIPKRFDELKEELKDTDILIVASNSSTPIITKNVLVKKPIVILDLSVPRNVSQDVSSLDGVSLINIDQLSVVVGETLRDRKKELPKAEQIIKREIKEFQEWFARRKWTPILNQIKQKLIEIQSKEISYHNRKLKNFNQEHAQQFSKRLISKATTHFANLLFENESKEQVKDNKGMTILK